MADPNIFHSLNIQPATLYNYEFEKAERPPHQIDPIVNVENPYYYSCDPINAETMIEKV